MLADAVLLLYYAVTTEFITTVAHVCAIVLGQGLYILTHYTQERLSYTTLSRPPATQ